MAFTLGAWTKSHVHPFTSAPGGQASNQPPTIAYHFEMADQAVTMTPVAQAPTGVSWARAVIRQKGWGSGTGTVGPVYELQVAYDSGFTSQVRDLDHRTALRNGNDQTLILTGPVPDAQTYTFARIAVTLSGSDVITYDAILDFIPGI
jgi:hypothetical protein